MDSHEGTKRWRRGVRFAEYLRSLLLSDDPAGALALSCTLSDTWNVVLVTRTADERVPLNRQLSDRLASLSRCSPSTSSRHAAAKH